MGTGSGVRKEGLVDLYLNDLKISLAPGDVLVMVKSDPEERAYQLFPNILRCGENIWAIAIEETPTNPDALFHGVNVQTSEIAPIRERVLEILAEHGCERGARKIMIDNPLIETTYVTLNGELQSLVVAADEAAGELTRVARDAHGNVITDEESGMIEHETVSGDVRIYFSPGEARMVLTKLNDERG